jgi:hypothetical protein
MCHLTSVTVTDRSFTPAAPSKTKKISNQCASLLALHYFQQGTPHGSYQKASSTTPDTDHLEEPITADGGIIKRLLREGQGEAISSGSIVTGKMVRKITYFVSTLYRPFGKWNLF